MFETREILLSSILPAAVVMGIVLAARLFGARAIAMPFALAAGFAVSYYALYRPAFPPSDAIQWLCFGAIGLGAMGPVDHVLSQRRGFVVALRIGFVLVLSVGLVWLLSRPLLEHTWEAGARYAWVGGTAAAALLLWLALDALSRRISPPLLSMAMVVCSACLAATSMFSGSRDLGLTAGILTSAVGGMLIAAVVFRHESLAGAILVAALLFVGIIACASTHFYSYTPTANSVLLLISPLFAWIAAIPALRRARAPVRWAITTVAVLAPAGLAATLAGIDFFRSMKSGYDSGW